MKTLIPRFFLFSAAAMLFALTSGYLLQNSDAQTQPVPPPDANAPASDSSAQPTVTSAELPANIPPNSPLAQVVRLAQSGVDESVILSYINNSGIAFNLTSDQIIYLKDLGLPNDSVTAMIQRDQQLGATANATPAPAPETAATAQAETAVQPAEVTQNYFYDTLSPYGGWVNVQGYGLCWRPTVVAYDSTWQPYCEHGHWVYTDAGWYWTSDYAWGATAFHYGRWFHDQRFGWCWWPETTWGPSWVCWRYSNDYCGWAPLPPRCVFREGTGIVFNGAVVSAGFDFGIGVNFFTFVPTRNFCDPHPGHFRVPRTQVTVIFNRTTVINNFNVNSHNHTVVNNGIPPQRITAVSKTPIHQIAIRDSTVPGARGEQFGSNGGTLVVNRPHIPENAVSTLNGGVRPPMVRQNNASHPVIINGNGNNSHTTFSGQNNFSPPGANHNPPPDRNWTAPQTAQPEHNNIGATIPQHQAPVAVYHSLTPAATVQTPPANYNQQAASVRWQDSVPTGTPRSYTRYSGARQNYSEPSAVSTPHQTMPASAPSQSQPGGGHNGNQNWPGH